MGYYKFIQAMLTNAPIVVYGDGNQIRGNTYVSDCVEATIRAANAPSGEVYNVGGGEAASVWEILRRLENLAGSSARVQMEPARPGDQRQTLADTKKITNHLGWEPRTSLNDGLRHQWNWQSAAHFDESSASNR
jgi:nucleoside-diphosphate-sugar epimerase